MSSATIQQLTAAGGPFELNKAIINGMQCRVFKDTPKCLTSTYGALQQYADRDLAVFADRRITYQIAAEQAAALAKILSDNYDIKKGTRVAIVMRNTPEWLISFLAVTSLGAIPALVNSRGTPDEISYCVMSTQCKLVISDSRTEQGLDATDAGTIPLLSFELEKAFTLSGEKAPIEAPALAAGLPIVESEPDEVAMILYTSGTTGRPKGALLTHQGVMTGLKTNQYSSTMIGIQIAERYGIDYQTMIANRPQYTTLLMFPLFHVSGLQAVFLTNFLQGGKVVMMPRWGGEEALKLIEREKVTMFPGVPLMYWDMLRAPDVEKYDLSSMTNLSVAGQSTPLPLFDAIKSTFPQAIIGCGYGMTETNGAISLLVGEDLVNNPTSVGHAVATTEIKLMKDDGSEAAQGERGEICVRGATIMKGYDNQPEDNDKSFSSGWYHTGDIGVQDEEMRLYIVDRSTEMVISGGENIYCAEIERVLSQAPGVLESVTFGMPDDRLGEKLIALIRTHKDSKQTPESITDFIKQKLAGYKLPAEMFLVTEALPTNAVGKVLKNEARKVYKKLAS
ncbi:MAG: long-chain acyl-CoA synthetase [Arenicella sp.]|jgi:long-chain acyl-CoA synthetase